MAGNGSPAAIACCQQSSREIVPRLDFIVRYPVFCCIRLPWRQQATDLEASGANRFRLLPATENSVENVIKMVARI
jgi:hypothetical protein